jgi:hypothetical protein
MFGAERREPRQIALSCLREASPLHSQKPFDQRLISSKFLYVVIAEVKTVPWTALVRPHNGNDAPCASFPYRQIGQLRRLIVLWLTLYDRAMSVSTSPASRRAIASFRRWPVSFGLRSRIPPSPSLARALRRFEFGSTRAQTPPVRLTLSASCARTLHGRPALQAEKKS